MKKFLIMTIAKFYTRWRGNPELTKLYNDVLNQDKETKEIAKLNKITIEYQKKGYVSNKKLYIMRTLAKKYQGK